MQIVGLRLYEDMNRHMISRVEVVLSPMIRGNTYRMNRPPLDYAVELKEVRERMDKVVSDAKEKAK